MPLVPDIVRPCTVLFQMGIANGRLSGYGGENIFGEQL